MTLSLALDILISVLLVLTIGYAISLNRRLGAFHKDRVEMEALARTFVEATSKADASMEKLKGSTDSVARSLETALNEAQTVRGDLAYLIERGSQLADRLEGTIRAKRGTSEATPPSPPRSSRTAPLTDEPAPNTTDDTDDAHSDAERELLKALRSVR